MAASCAPAPDASHDASIEELRLGVVGPQVPGFGLNVIARTLSEALLVNPHGNGEVEPGLVEEWQVSDDGRRWRLTLRPDLHFSDGTPLTARDVSTLIESRRGRTVNPFPLERIEVVDERHFDVLLGQPSPFLLNALAEVSVSRPSTAVGDSVGIGPYLSTSETNDSVVLEASESYYRGRPSVRKLTYVAFPTLRTAWSAMLRGELDGLQEAPSDAVEFIEETSQFKAYSFTRPYTYFLGFNLRHEWLGDPGVRRAIAHAVRREQLVSSALRGRGEPAYFHLVGGHWTVASDIPPLPYSPALARSLVDGAAGNSNHPGSLRRLSCLILALDRFGRIGQELQRQLLDVGIDLELEVVELEEMNARLASGKFELFLLEAAGGNPGRIYQFWHSSMQSRVLNLGYTAADDPLDRWKAARDRDEARAAMRDVQLVMRDDPPAVFLARDRVARVLHRQFVVPPEADGLDALYGPRFLPFVQRRPSASVAAH
ncbi:MAG: ABC transporter substrate-binding protein [Vicinamibacterales bacterium]